MLLNRGSATTHFVHSTFWDTRHLLIDTILVVGPVRTHEHMCVSLGLPRCPFVSTVPGTSSRSRRPHRLPEGKVTQGSM